MSTTLTSTQSRFLRGQAHDLKALLQIGAKGLTPAFLAELDAVLEQHELVKVKVGGEDRDARDAMIAEIANSHDAIVTIEEGCTMGGGGSAIAETLAAAGLSKPLLILGLPDRFVDHGDPGLLLAQCGLNAEGIEASIRQRFL